MIKLREKIGYGFGDMASSMFWKLFGAYLMIFYTDVFGLPAAMVGTMFLVTRVWDSVFDPIIGIAADHHNNAAVKAVQRVYQIICHQNNIRKGTDGCLQLNGIGLSLFKIKPIIFLTVAKRCVLPADAVIKGKLCTFTEGQIIIDIKLPRY